MSQPALSRTSAPPGPGPRDLRKKKRRRPQRALIFGATGPFSMRLRIQKRGQRLWRTEKPSTFWGHVGAERARRSVSLFVKGCIGSPRAYRRGVVPHGESSGSKSKEKGGNEQGQRPVAAQKETS
ncbi:hypothetical protein NDU88_006463 [Pleurodeles waltl]|uniref:Uncharacterized protein n=1 Tax=Pleurodeles waltl TaxID=8319 RepID=A0AAV7TWW7_PLEWA|nr:hypothetical protein NDU88_006463 [Pleurodeles waltl]